MDIGDKTLFMFDLDGTLTDPKSGITKSVQYSLRHFGINVDDPDELVSFIGPPLRESYRKYYHFSNDEAERAVVKYREYFTERGIFDNIMYKNIDRLLMKLTEYGKTLCIATSKPTVMAEQVLRHFNLHGYFTFISGAELDGRRSEKYDIIQYALDHYKADPDCAVMIGDREHDIIGAKKTGVASVGVTYGYGGSAELECAGADFIVSSVDALEELLTGGR